MFIYMHWRMQHMLVSCGLSSGHFHLINTLENNVTVQQGHLVYECNSLCKCDATCHNRVLQKGIQVKLEIFKTEKKVITFHILFNSQSAKSSVSANMLCLQGWAVRAGEAISRGTFVCEYIGEVMNDVEGNKRGQRFIILSTKLCFSFSSDHFISWLEGNKISRISGITRRHVAIFMTSMLMLGQEALVKGQYLM